MVKRSEEKWIDESLDETPINFLTAEIICNRAQRRLENLATVFHLLHIYIPLLLQSPLAGNDT